MVIGVIRDISREKVAEEHQKLILSEMNHRVKNTLATVISIAHQTAAGAPSIEAFLEGFDARFKRSRGLTIC